MITRDELDAELRKFRGQLLTGMVVMAEMTISEYHNHPGIERRLDRLDQRLDRYEGRLDRIEANLERLVRTNEELLEVVREPECPVCKRRNETSGVDR